MVNLFFDPSLLACPSIEKDKTEFEDFIENLLDWKMLKDCNWSKIFSTEIALDILSKNSMYPAKEKVISCLKHFQIDYIDFSSVIKIIDSLLQKIYFIEDDLNIKISCAEDVELSPIFNLGTLPNEFEETFTSILVYMALRSELKKDGNYHIALTNKINSNIVKILGKLELIEFEENSVYQNSLTIPFKIDHSFYCCSKYNDLYKIIDPVNLWVNTTDENVYQMAIKLNTLKVANDLAKQISIEDLNNFSFGRDFFKTAKLNNFLKNESNTKNLLKSISDLLLGINLSKTHHLRINKGGDSPPKKRDNYIAWRKDIDYEYHVHYWSDGNSFEFASIVTHNNYDIN